MWVLRKNVVRTTFITSWTVEAKQEMGLLRSKSTGSLDKIAKQFDAKWFTRYCGYCVCDKRCASVSSANDRSECDSSEKSKLDSGVGKLSLDFESLCVLEQKIDKISELLKEQQILLKAIQENINNAKPSIPFRRSFAGGDDFAKDNNGKETISTNETSKAENSTNSEAGNVGKPALYLLRPDEITQETFLDQIIKSALDNFLQNDKSGGGRSARCARARRGARGARYGGCECGCGRGCECGCGCGCASGLARALSDAYMPLVHRAHRRLLRRLTAIIHNSFAKLEEGSAMLYKPVNEASKKIQASLKDHQSLLESTDPGGNYEDVIVTLKKTLEVELKAWRCAILKELVSEVVLDEPAIESASFPDPPELTTHECAPPSPPQPANPDTSIIDRLMKGALIAKRMREGDVGAAFEMALNAADLSLVVGACRAAPRPPPALRAPLLLSLLQQLATDMVHDTQLKCRYLEEAIWSLRDCEEPTRAHLPLVVGEVRAHLSRFLRAYPNHRASRRVTLILMAAEELLK